MKQIIIKTSYNQLHDQSLFIRDDHYNEKNVIHNILFKKPAGRARLNTIDMWIPCKARAPKPKMIFGYKIIIIIHVISLADTWLFNNY